MLYVLVGIFLFINAILGWASLIIVPIWVIIWGIGTIMGKDKSGLPREIRRLLK